MPFDRHRSFSALAEIISRIDKADVILRRGAPRLVDAWNALPSKGRIDSTIGDIPPVEAEALYDAAEKNLLLAARRKPNSLRHNLGGSDYVCPLFLGAHGRLPTPEAECRKRKDQALGTLDLIGEIGEGHGAHSASVAPTMPLPNSPD
jgi:hypothetical protein